MVISAYSLKIALLPPFLWSPPSSLLLNKQVFYSSNVLYREFFIILQQITKKNGHRGIGFAPIVCLIDKDPTKK